MIRRIVMSNNGVNKNNDTRKIITMIAMVCTLMLCTTGATYAYLAFTASNNAMTGQVAASGLTLTVTRADLKASNTGVMVPQKATALSTAMNSTNKCVDGNGNIVCMVYTITISTTSTATMPAKGTITFTTPSTNLKWKLVKSTTDGSAPTTTASEVTSATAATTSAVQFVAPTFTSTNKSFTYYMVVWIDETNAVQNDSGSWRATIAFNPATGTGITSTITS